MSGNLDVAKWNLYFSKRWAGENGKFFLSFDWNENTVSQTKCNI
jgi:hypothetical protein